MWFKPKAFSKCDNCARLSKALELEQKRVGDLTDKVIALANPAVFNVLTQGKEEVQGPLTKTVYDAKTGEAIKVPLDDYLAAKKAAINGDKTVLGK